MEASRPTSGEYLYISYLRDLQPIKRHTHLQKFRYRYTATILKFLSFLADTDPCGNHRISTKERRQSVSGGGKSLGWLRPKCIKRSAWWKRQRCRWLADLLVALYYLFSFHLLANLYCQYWYDFSKLRLMKLQAFVKNGLMGNSEFQELATNLFDEIDRSKWTLHLVGSPHRHLSIAIEALHLYLLLFALIAYNASRLWYNFIWPFDAHFLREMLDFENEDRYLHKTIRNQVSRFIESGRTFYRIHSKGCCHKSTKRRLTSFRDVAPASNSGIRHFLDGIRFLHDLEANKQYRAYDLLARLLTHEALLPFNKSPAWSEHRIRLLQIFMSSLSIFGLIFFIILMTATLQLRDRNEPLTWSDMALLVSTFGLINIIGFACVFFSTCFFTSALDQIVIIDKMCSLIKSCIQLNSAEFNALQLLRATSDVFDNEWRLSKAPKGKSLPPIKLDSVSVDKINSNCIFTIMHYKIFIVQYYSAKQTFNLVTGFATALILLIPIIIKLHVPYLMLFNFEDAKWFAMAISPLSLIPFNIVLVPICHMDARFMHMYRNLSSLIAHIIEVESHPYVRGTYEEHAVALLLKELHHTCQFLERSKVLAFGLETSWTSLVKSHFWWGIVVLSILIDDTQYTEQVPSSFFNDPFRVFSRSHFIVD